MPYMDGMGLWVILLRIQNTILNRPFNDNEKRRVKKKMSPISSLSKIIATILGKDFPPSQREKLRDWSRHHILKLSIFLKVGRLVNINHHDPLKIP